MGEQRHKASRTLLTVAAVVIVIAGLKAAGTLLLPFLVAVFLSVLAAPAVLWMERRGMPAGIAVVVAMIGVLLILVVFGALLGTSIVGFDEALPGYRLALEEMTEATIVWLQGWGLDLSTDEALASLAPGSIMGMMGTFLGSLIAALSSTALVALTMVFILLEIAGFPKKLRAAIGDPNADLSQWGVMLHEVQRYLAIKTVVSLATGAAATVLLALLGVDFPILWGLVAFLLNYIPTVGSIIAAVPAVLIAMVQPELGPGYAAIVAMGYLLINTVLGNIVEPQLLGRRLGLSPLVVFSSLVFWGWVWGPVGMLLSVPLTMMLRIMLEQSEELRWLAVLLGNLPDIEAPSPSKSLVARIRLRRGVDPEEILRTGALDRVEIQRGDPAGASTVGRVGTEGSRSVDEPDEPPTAAASPAARER